MDTVSPHMLSFAPGQISLFAGTPGQSKTPPLRRADSSRIALALSAARRRRLGVLAGILITALTTRQYSSTARLEITRETARVVDIDSVQRDTSIGDQEFYQTQYGLLQTKALSERVVRELSWRTTPQRSGHSAAKTSSRAAGQTSLSRQIARGGSRLWAKSCSTMSRSCRCAVPALST